MCTWPSHVMCGGPLLKWQAAQYSTAGVAAQRSTAGGAALTSAVCCNRAPSQEAVVLNHYTKHNGAVIMALSACEWSLAVLAALQVLSREIDRRGFSSIEAGELDHGTLRTLLPKGWVRD